MIHSMEQKGLGALIKGPTVAASNLLISDPELYILTQIQRLSGERND